MSLLQPPSYRVRLLIVTLLSLVVLAIGIQFIRVACNHYLLKYDSLDRQFWSTVSVGKTASENNGAVVISSSAGRGVIDTQKVDRAKLKAISEISDQLYAQIMLVGRIICIAFAAQGLLAFPLIVAVYLLTNSPAPYSTTARLAAIATIPCAILYVVAAIFGGDAPPIQRIGFLATYPVAWFMTLWFLLRYFSARYCAPHVGIVPLATLVVAAVIVAMQHYYGHQFATLSISVQLIVCVLLGFVCAASSIPLCLCLRSVVRVNAK